MVDGDGVIRQSEDTIKPTVCELLKDNPGSPHDSLSKSEGKSGFLGSLSKILSLDCEVTDGEVVFGNKPFHGSRTILDGELGAIGLVGVGEADEVEDERIDDLVRECVLLVEEHADE